MDELPVLDELERRLIAGCYGSEPAGNHEGRRRRGLWRRPALRGLGWDRVGVVISVAVSVLVVAVLVVRAGPRHGRPVQVVRPGHRQLGPPVVRNYALSSLPPLPRGSVSYLNGNLGTSAASANPHDTYVFDTTHLQPGETPTRSTLTIRASGLKPAPRGSVYAVWLAPAGYTHTSGDALAPLPPYSLVGIVSPPVGADGELIARAPTSVDVSTQSFELLITIEHKPMPVTPGHAVLRGVVNAETGYQYRLRNRRHH